MLRLQSRRLILVLSTLLAVLVPTRLAAQDDPNEAPLGDVARTLRKKTPPSQAVIDDDNLSKVMEQADGRHPPGSALKFLMAGAGNGFQVSAPDVTCSLAFTANVKSLLSNQYAQMELPPSEVVKLEGPATIERDALIVAVYNRTDWHVSEVAVAFTVVKKNQTRNASLSESVRLAPVVAGGLLQEDEVRAEKKPDRTLIYRMRAAAPPSVTTVFSAPLNLEIAADEEWHWAIVQARGYPPQSYVGPAGQPTSPVDGTSLPATASTQLASPQPTLSPVSVNPQNSPVVSTSQNPQ
jgi:hypothetical protein